MQSWTVGFSGCVDARDSAVDRAEEEEEEEEEDEASALRAEMSGSGMSEGGAVVVSPSAICARYLRIEALVLLAAEKAEVSKLRTSWYWYW